MWKMKVYLSVMTPLMILTIGDRDMKLTNLGTATKFASVSGSKSPVTFNFLQFPRIREMARKWGEVPLAHRMTGMQKQRRKGFQQTEVDRGEQGHGWVLYLFVHLLHEFPRVVDVVTILSNFCNTLALGWVKTAVIADKLWNKALEVFDFSSRLGDPIGPDKERSTSSSPSR